MSSSPTTGNRGGFPGENPAGLLHECLATGVIIVDAHGKIAACSAEAAHILRLDIKKILHASADALPAALAKLAAANKTVSNREIELAGDTTLRVSVIPLKTETVLVLNNFSGGPAFDQNLRRLDRLASLGTLSASMAHEIKNGMVAIKTFVDLLAQKGEDAELTDVVGRELQRINGIVSQMLRFAAPKAGTFATVKIHDVLDRSLRLLQHQFAAKMVSVKRDFHAASDTVRGDDAQLQQVFMNLLLNAIEALGTNGTLTVSTKLDGKNLLIEVQDNGVGVVPENLERIFEPFFTTKKSGTGLGLAISRRIVLEHQGTIEARSQIGQGSTFSLTLPLA